MSIFVFVGPTLGVDEAQTILDATYLPPASQGDVFRVVTMHDARIVGIIDGHFQAVPSVWHKELLWVMTQGVHVMGAASMGALRAAELAAFGMVGEGRIFEAYRNGVLEPYDAPFEDDDEVAVIHAPAELGYRPLSDALVDIRCTLDFASQEKVISSEIRDRLVSLAKSCFYAERSYDALLDLANNDGVPPPALTRLRDWLPQGRISQKRQDARALLAKIETGNFMDRKQVTFDFNHTTMWDRFTAEALGQQSACDETELTQEGQAVFAEVQLQPEAYWKVKQKAERVLRIGPCAPVRRVALAMLEVLRQEGKYASLAARAGRKMLQLADVQAPRASDLTGLQVLQLLDWYFDRRLASEIPDNVEAFAHSLGYSDRKDFVDALLREYSFANSEAGLEPS